jgi:hypothetical protein
MNFSLKSPSQTFQKYALAAGMNRKIFNTLMAVGILAFNRPEVGVDASHCGGCSALGSECEKICNSSMNRYLNSR